MGFALVRDQDRRRGLGILGLPAEMGGERLEQLLALVIGETRDMPRQFQFLRRGPPGGSRVERGQDGIRHRAGLDRQSGRSGGEPEAVQHADDSVLQLEIEGGTGGEIPRRLQFEHDHVRILCLARHAPARGVVAVECELRRTGFRGEIGAGRGDLEFVLRAVGGLQHRRKFGEIEIAAARAADLAAEIGEGLEPEGGDALELLHRRLDEVAGAQRIARPGRDGVVVVRREDPLLVLGDDRDLLGRDHRPACRR